MKVRNMTNKAGNPIANQFIINDYNNHTSLFQSYSSAIALIDKSNTVHLSEHWDFSTTTGKYRNMFLNETKKETERKIKDGTYKLDLNLDGSIDNV